MIFLTAIAVAGGLKELTNETSGIQGTLEGSGAARSWGEQGHTQEPVPALLDVPEPARVEEVVSAPPVSPQPAEVLPEPVVESPEPTVSDIPGPVEGSAESVICGVFGAYCADALAVARCESTDYYAPGNTYHIGAFQLAFRYHATKFAAHGWDMWLEGNDPYKNAVIALEVFAGRGYSWIGTSGWPHCGWRAGY